MRSRHLLILSLLALSGCPQPDPEPDNCGCRPGCPAYPGCVPPVLNRPDLAMRPDLSQPPDMLPPPPSDPDFTFDPPMLDFGKLMARRDSLSLTVKVTSKTYELLNGVKLEATGANAGEFTISDASPSGCTGIWLDPGKTCTVTITFTPTVAGKANAALIVHTLAVDGKTDQASLPIPLLGDADLGMPKLTADPAALDFGDTHARTTSQHLAVTIRNVGNAATVGLMTGMPTSVFLLDPPANSTCHGTLPVGGTCTVYLVFAPPSEGDYDGDIEIWDATAQIHVPLKGHGIDPAALQISSTATIADQFIGDTGPGALFHVTNTGADTSGLLTATLTGVNPGDFLLTADGCSGQTLAGGAGCDVQVAFHPSVRGSRSAQLTVSGTPGGSAPIMLQARGRKHATLVASPASYTFTTATEGWTLGKLITVTNDSDENIAKVTLVSSPGANDNGPAQFGLGTGTTPFCNNAPLAAGASCHSSVAFQAHVQDTYQGTITVSGAPASDLVLPLTGTFDFGGTLYPPGHNVDFGSNLSKPSILRFAIHNDSKSAVGPLTTSIQGSNFSIGLDQCSGKTVDSGSGCILDVQFTPTFSGAFTGQLTVGAGAASVTYSLSASALMPAFQFSPALLDFGPVGVGRSSTPLSVIVHNVSNRAAPTDNYTTDDTFSVVGSDCPASLGIDASCTVTLRFGPRAGGTFNASLVFYNAEGTPTLALTGVGQ